MFKLHIENTSGIDAKMAQKIVQRASDFEADMVLSYEGKEVDLKSILGIIDLKSILGIMSLAVLEGAAIDIEAKGNDAKEAIEALKELIK